MLRGEQGPGDGSGDAGTETQGVFARRACGADEGTRGDENSRVDGALSELGDFADFAVDEPGRVLLHEGTRVAAPSAGGPGVCVDWVQSGNLHAARRDGRGRARGAVGG